MRIPECKGHPCFSDELHLDSEMSRIIFRFRKTIIELPTLESLKVDPSKILYSVSAIHDTYDGEPSFCTYWFQGRHRNLEGREKRRKLWKIITFGFANKFQDRKNSKLNKVSVKMDMNICQYVAIFHKKKTPFYDCTV